jgi:hypothetical protein
MFAIILPMLETTPRAREAFTVVFYGTGIFGCKTAQVSETPRESVRSDCLKSRLRNIVKNRAKSVRAIRNPLLYPAELRGADNDELCRCTTEENPVGMWPPGTVNG